MTYHRAKEIDLTKEHPIRKSLRNRTKSINSGLNRSDKDSEEYELPDSEDESEYLCAQ